MDSNDEYELSPPVERRTDYAQKFIEAAEKPRVVDESITPPPPPNAPMFSGVFTFPWYPTTLYCWVVLSLGLMLLGLFTGTLLGPGMRVGLLAIRALAPATGMLAVLVFAYASANCLAVIEETANGWDAITDWPAFDWRGWCVSFGSVVFIAGQAALVGYGISWVTWTPSWITTPVAAYLLFPIALLSSLEVDSLWLPISKPVLKSLYDHPGKWGLFYLEITVLGGGFLLLFVIGLLTSPWGTLIGAGPVLAALLLIDARLIGRLALCIAMDEEKVRNERRVSVKSLNRETN